MVVSAHTLTVIFLEFSLFYILVQVVVPLNIQFLVSLLYAEYGTIGFIGISVVGYAVGHLFIDGL